MGSSTDSKSMLFLQKHATLGINQPLPILTKSLSYVFPSIFKLPLNHTWLHFQTLSLTSNSNLHDLFVNLCQFPSHIHYPPTHSLPILLFMSLLFAIYRNLNSELLPYHLRPHQCTTSKKYYCANTVAKQILVHPCTLKFAISHKEWIANMPSLGFKPGPVRWDMVSCTIKSY